MVDYSNDISILRKLNDYVKRRRRLRGCADWSETKIYDLVLFRRILENSMTQLARVTEVTDCMYVNSCALSRVR